MRLRLQGRVGPQLSSAAQEQQERRVPKSEIVVALDIGTTKVCTLVADIAGEDQIEILGMGLAPSTGMRKGVVVDIPATMLSIRDSVANAERAAGAPTCTGPAHRRRAALCRC